MTKYFQGFLIFGRRSEIDDRKKQERWSGESLAHGRDLRTMTYDRLLEHRLAIMPDMEHDKLAVCSYRDRRFVAKSVCL